LPLSVFGRGRKAPGRDIELGEIPLEHCSCFAGFRVRQNIGGVAYSGAKCRVDVLSPPTSRRDRSGEKEPEGQACQKPDGFHGATRRRATAPQTSRTMTAPM